MLASSNRLLRAVTVFRKSILLCSFFVLCAVRVFALGEDYIDETLVYATLERGAVEPGYWFKSEKEDQKKKFHRIERCFGTFRRSFTLPEDADSMKVTADLRDGVLRVHLPTTPVSKIKSYAS